MLHSIALGSILYMALELTQSFLEREYVSDKLQGQVYALEAELDELRKEAAVSDAEGSARRTSWWKLW